MAEIFGIETGFELPSLTSGSLGATLMLVAIVIVALIFCAVIMWAIYMSKVYKYKIEVFENVSNQGYQPTTKDTARLVKVGDGGEEILYLRKKKAYRTAYGRKMGKNTYWFAVGQDGYWYNFLLGDLDAKLGMLDIEPIDRDMRYMHVAIRKNIEQNYKKQNFLEKYGVVLASFIVLLMLLVGGWFILDKMADITSNLSTAVKTSGDLVNPMQQALAKVDEICSRCGGSGLAT